MTKSGVQYPEAVDIVAAKDGRYQLVLVETKPLRAEDALALQQKLKNYLTFGLGGQLNALYPASKGRPLTIRVMLYAQPEPLILDFLQRFKAYAAEEKVSVVVQINGKDLEL